MRADGTAAQRGPLATRSTSARAAGVRACARAGRTAWGRPSPATRPLLGPPALQGADADARGLASRAQARSASVGGGDVAGDDRASFFDSTSKAAVSVSARSLRNNARASSLMRRLSCWVCSGLARASAGVCGCLRMSAGVCGRLRARPALARRFAAKPRVAARTCHWRGTTRSWPLRPSRRCSTPHQTGPALSRPARKAGLDRSSRRQRSSRLYRGDKYSATGRYHKAILSKPFHPICSIYFGVQKSGLLTRPTAPRWAAT